MRTPKLLVLDASDDLRLQVERVTSALRPCAEVVGCDDVELVNQVITEQGPFDVLIARRAESTEVWLRELRKLRLRLPETNLILAFDEWRTGSLRQTVRTGAMDILRLPATDEVILEAVEQALAALWAAPVEAAAPYAPASRKARVIAVSSATGGCGKAFLATNIAYHLQSRFQKRTCVIDLDLQFGELSTALRLKPKYTIADLLGGDEDNEGLGERLDEYVARHETGIHVLAAPDEPAAADAVEARDVARVIQAANSRFDYVVIDTPASLSEAVLVALEHADQVFAIATLDLPSVRNLGVLLATFKQLKVPAERVKLVLNKVEPDVGMDIAGVTRYFPQGFSMVIPYGREANRSLNMGMPMLAYAPRSNVGKVLASGLAKTVEVGAGSTGDTAGLGTSGRRRRRLGLHRDKST